MAAAVWVGAGCGPSGPADDRPGGAAGRAVGVEVGGAVSVVCCRSWAAEVTGLGGAGEEEEEGDSTAGAEVS